MFNLYKNTRSQLENVMSQLSAEDRSRATQGEAQRYDYSPFDEVSDFLQEHHNYFPELEEAAEALRTDFGLERQLMSSQLVKLLEKRFNYRVDREDSPPGSSVIRRIEPDAQRLVLSPSLTEQTLKFQLAASAGMLVIDKARLLERIIGKTTRHAETPRLIKVNLANYFAGALMLPYGDFFAEVQRSALRPGATSPTSSASPTRRWRTGCATWPTPSGAGCPSTSSAPTWRATSPSATAAPAFASPPRAAAASGRSTSPS